MEKTKDWFLERIGKRIYRDKSSCLCHTCEEVSENGLVVNDEMHATFLFDVQNDFAAEGVYFNYRDTK